MYIEYINACCVENDYSKVFNAGNKKSLMIYSIAKIYSAKFNATISMLFFPFYIHKNQFGMLLLQR
jgi:hypothetical protein